MKSKRRGSLTVVGTGIRAGSQMTREALDCIKSSEKVLYLVADSTTASWLEKLNPSAQSLSSLYKEGKPRCETYREMTQTIMDCVRNGEQVCAAFYGHPGVFVAPSHEAIRQARSEGYEAIMLPGISAEDCLFADLGVDPGKSGCQSFEATDFLAHRRKFDPSSPLILWQIAMIGISDCPMNPSSRRGVEIIVNVLKRHYPADHEIIVYQASSFPYPVADPSIRYVRLLDLPNVKITPASTVYIPPIESTLDHDMLRMLGL